MVIDTQLLSQAKALAAKVSEADKEALLARADYHTAVRRLHLAGGSLREIADALGVSHQRVQQIVSAAGGSWWQRMWRTRAPDRDAVCTFCERPPSELEKLLAGPDVYVCDGCVSAAEQAIVSGESGAFARAKKGRGKKCSFCGKRASVERPAVTSARGTVCGSCLRAAREIIDASAGAPSPAGGDQ